MALRRQRPGGDPVTTGAALAHGRADLAHGRADLAHGRALLDRAAWAARAFARYDVASVRRIVDAAAQAAAAHAEEFAVRAVEETGFGVAEHKVLKNLACSTGLVQAYADHDYVTPWVDADAKVVHVPRPAGIVLALTPSTNPVATVFFKVLLALMTRNTVVVCPHPLAKGVCGDAARVMAEAAVGAGAPDGCVQWVEEPSVALLEALMADERTGVVVATGGTAVVRAAYRSGTPAIGVGPGNVPVLVDATADLDAAARRIVDSKSFDNSILCTNESLLLVEDAVADDLVARMCRAGAYLLDDAERDAVRDAVFPGGVFDTSVVGRDATEIAARAGVRVPARTRVLLAPFDLVVPEEPLAHEKLCPVLGLVRVPGAARGIDAARAALRISGAGHSAAIHSTDPATILAFGAAVQVLRVSVNAGASLGGSGLETNLAPSMTIGTGFAGRSSVGENLQPHHLVNHTRLAWNADAGVPFPAELLDPASPALQVWTAPAGAVPPYPVPSNAPDYPYPHSPRDPARPAPRSEPLSPDAAALREQIRRLVVEELRQIVGG
jgi:acyl-CoA reductase-like NAD-dependent aldehyde dehydrogenase